MSKVECIILVLHANIIEDSVKNLKVNSSSDPISEWETITLCEMCEMLKTNMNLWTFFLWSKEKLSTRLYFLFSLTSKFVRAKSEACKRFWNHDNTFKSLYNHSMMVISSVSRVGVRKIFIERKSVRWLLLFSSVSANGELSFTRRRWAGRKCFHSDSLTRWLLIECERVEKGRSKKRSNLKSQIEKLSQFCYSSSSFST